LDQYAADKARIAQIQAKAVRQAREAREDRRAARRAALMAATPPAPSQAAEPKPTPAQVPGGSPQAEALALLPDFGQSPDQMPCLAALWTRESGWQWNAANPSGAYGIPQALPGSKMASAGPDWMTNPVTQIKWGLGYIQSIYSTACAAWSHEQAYGWY